MNVVAVRYPFAASPMGRVRRAAPRAGRGLARLVASCTLVAMCTTPALAAGPFRSASESWPLASPAHQTLFRLASDVGDLDEDGRPDLVVRGLGALFVRRGLAGGSFAPATTLSDPSGSYAPSGPIEIADFDGDGHADLVAPPWWFPGLGDGTFAPWRGLPNGSSFEPGPLLVSDVTSDGIVDLVMAGDSQIGVRPGLGAGAVDSLVTSSASSGEHLALGDVNGDGHPDIAVASSAGYANLWLGAGDGGFPEWAFGAGSGGPVALADLDGDGELDLVSGPAVWLGDGAGGFSASDTLAFEAHVVADFDLDGDADLAGLDGPWVVVAAGDGAGRFAVVRRLVSGAGPYALRAVDFDGDGRMDLLASHRSGPSAQLYRNGPGGFSDPPRFAAGAVPVSVARLDADGDGDDDLVVGRRGDRRVSVLLGDGNGQLAVASVGEAAAGIRDLVVADLRGDGGLHVVVACDSAAALAVFPVLAGGALGARADLAIPPQPVALAVADLDLDGRDEVLCVHAGQAVTVLEADGAGVVSTHAASLQLAFAGGAATALATGDWSDDGIPDLAIGTDETWGGAAVVVAVGDGAGGFSSFVPGGAARPVGYRRSAGPLAAADVDGDGDDDLVCAARGDSAGVRRTWLRGWRFQSGQIEAALAAPDDAPSHPGVAEDLAIADLDGDGLPEALVSDSEGHALHVHAALATTFGSPARSFGSAEGARGVATGDFDGDGRADVAVTGAAEGNVVLLMGAGPGTPAAAPVPGAGGDGSIGLAVREHPARGAIVVAFSIAAGAAGRLELFDLAGRRIESSEIPAATAGERLAALGAGRGLRAGVYLVRLRAGAASRSVRAVLID